VILACGPPVSRQLTKHDAPKRAVSKSHTI